MNLLSPYLLRRDPHFANVSLLLSGQGENGQTTIPDTSSYAHTMARVGDTKILTAQGKWGNGSIYFDGTGDYHTITQISDEMAVRNGAFTVEAWVYLTGATTGTLFAKASSSGVAYEHVFGFNQTQAELYYGIRGTNQSLTRFFWPSTLTYNAWHHLVMQRDGSGNWACWADGQPTSSYQTAPLAGVLVFGGVINGTYNNAVDFGASSLTNSVGGTQPNIYMGNFYANDMRLTKGVARYSGTFTPPDLPFPSK